MEFGRGNREGSLGTSLSLMIVIGIQDQTQTLMKPTASSRSFSREDDADECKVKQPRRDFKAPLTLPVTPSLYDAPFPFYRRPAEIGRFSLDAKRCFHGDARQLRYYAPPPSEGPSPGFDLRDGYRDRYVQRDDSILLTTPYENREGWLLAVTLFRGTLYISEFETEAARKEREQRSEMLKELTHKLIKWWAQSFLPGVSRIVAGYRGPDGSVVGLETFETMQIFKLIRDDPGCWKPAVCMNFCAAFLAFLKTVVTEDNPKLVHLFAWNPGHPVSFTVHQDSQYRFLPDWYVEALSEEKPPTS
ncbi:hypothetical protein Chor_011580 [Crotalus horridus]